MKQNILVIFIGLLGFTFNINAQNKTENPVLSNGNTTKIEKKKTVIDKKGEQPKLKAKSKTTTIVVKKKESNTKKNKTSGTPQLGKMSKKEEK